VAALLAAAARSLPVGETARAVREQSLHLTLAFLGPVPDARVAELVALGQSLAPPVGEWRIDEIDHWRGGIVWAGSHTPPSGLLDYVAALQAGLKALGFAIEARQFVPHVTLYRKAQLPGRVPLPAPICWPLGGVRLIESLTSPAGATYHGVWQAHPPQQSEAQ
jgi:2'-5' RNA ligase